MTCPSQIRRFIIFSLFYFFFIIILLIYYLFFEFISVTTVTEIMTKIYASCGHWREDDQKSKKNISIIKIAV